MTKPFITLATSLEKELKKNISVVAFTEDLANGRNITYAMRSSVLYDANNEFTPIEGFTGQRITDENMKKAYWELMPQAMNNLYHEKSKYGQGGENGEQARIIDQSNRIIQGLKADLVEKNATIDRLAEEFNKVKAQPKKGPELDMLAQMQNVLEGVKSLYPTVHEFRYESKIVKVEGNEKIYHEEFKRILFWINKGHDVYLVGPAGTGKSHIAKQIAEALGQGFEYNNALQTAFDVTGFEDANGNYHDTPFYRAFTQGHVYCIDEMDASYPEALIVLNSALAQRHYTFPSVGYVTAHPDFRVVAGGNTSGKGADEEYTARQVLDSSSLDRFKEIPIDYSPAIEEHLAKGQNEMLEFLRDLRVTAKNNNIQLLVTYRAITGLLDGLEGVEAGFLTLEEALHDAVVKGMAKDDLYMVARNLEVTPQTSPFVKALKKLAK